MIDRVPFQKEETEFADFTVSTPPLPAPFSHIKEGDENSPSSRLIPLGKPQSSRLELTDQRKVPGISMFMVPNSRSDCILYSGSRFLQSKRAENVIFKLT